jgi:predicted SprT family Zn-dependent metalloprotease
MKLIDARNMLVSEMRQHGLLAEGWTWKFDRAKNRRGQTSWRYNDDGSIKRRWISLSENFVRLNNEDRVLATIRHEIAHALVGGTHGHDAVWQAKCREIGGNGQRCTAAVEVPAKWIGTCPGCGNAIHRHRMTAKAQRVACARCCRSNGGYDARFKFVWRQNA